MNVPGLLFRMMLLSGAIGGLAGGVHALGTVFRYVSGFSPGYGFVGIAVALLGRGNAWGILLPPSSLARWRPRARRSSSSATCRSRSSTSCRAS